MCFVLTTAKKAHFEMCSAPFLFVRRHRKGTIRHSMQHGDNSWVASSYFTKDSSTAVHQKAVVPYGGYPNGVHWYRYTSVRLQPPLVLQVCVVVSRLSSSLPKHVLILPLISLVKFQARVRGILLRQRVKKKWAALFDGQVKAKKKVLLQNEYILALKWTQT